MLTARRGRIGLLLRISGTENKISRFIFIDLADVAFKLSELADVGNLAGLALLADLLD